MQTTICKDCGGNCDAILAGLKESLGISTTCQWCRAHGRCRCRLIDTVRHGDRVTILVPAGIGRNGQEWKRATGKAVMRSAYDGWVLNMGGRYGTPGIASDSNIVEVRHASN